MPNLSKYVIIVIEFYRQRESSFFVCQQSKHNQLILFSSQPGPSRVAPPTPTTEDSTPLIPTDHTQQPVPSNYPSNHTHLPTSDSSSTVSSGSSATTTPNTSSSNTSSSSSTAPSSPASPPARTQGKPARSAPITQGAPPRPHSKHHQREKRHSFSAVNNLQHHQSSHRHSAEILSNESDGMY